MTIEQAFITTDIIAIENIVMSMPRLIAGAWGRVSYHTKSAAGILSDVTSTSIVVKDITGTIRVTYTAGNLVKVATGKYRYDFQIPVVALYGDWHVVITCSLGDREAVRTVHFQVTEK
jgi:RNase P/RNase MRP subunit p29